MGYIWGYSKAQNLFWGIDDVDAKKKQLHIEVQHKGGDQNAFLFAERVPETSEVWKALAKKQDKSTPPPE